MVPRMVKLRVTLFLTEGRTYNYDIIDANESIGIDNEVAFWKAKLEDKSHLIEIAHKTDHYMVKGEYIIAVHIEELEEDTEAGYYKV